MLITWRRTVRGRRSVSLRFNKLLAWNTFPLPPTEAKTRVSIIAAEEVIAAREQHPGQALADLYELGVMPQDLCNAHKELDRRIDQLFGLTGPNPTELERQDRLFTLYAERVS